MLNKPIFRAISVLLLFSMLIFASNTKSASTRLKAWTVNDTPVNIVQQEISGNLTIAEPANNSVIVGPATITFIIENTGYNEVEFLEGDPSNRIDLEIEYSSAGGEIVGWGIQLWSTSYYGLTLAPGEKYQQTLIYDPSEYKESVPPSFVSDAPYGEAVIRLVHWKMTENGYSIGEFGKTEIQVIFLSVATANIDLLPHTLNLKSKGKWITAYIELTECYNISDVNITSIVLNDTVPIYLKKTFPKPVPAAIGDYDDDCIPDLMIKFERAEVISYILANINLSKLFEEGTLTITLTITGKLNDGTPFQGSTRIRVIMPRYGKFIRTLQIYPI